MSIQNPTKGETLNGKIISITGPKPKDGKWKFLIKIEGNDKPFEYFSATETQDEFISMIPRYFSIGRCNDFGCEILPCEPPSERVPTQAPAANIPQQSKPRAINPKCANAAGSSITFAAGYSKDLLAAKIAALAASGQPPMEFDEEADYLERMSEVINDIICKKIIPTE